MASILIRNIKSLVGVKDTNDRFVSGAAMKELGVIDNAYLLLEDGLIKAYGPNSNAPGRADEIVDATGKFVFPCWCDSHTHIVYAGSRETEFVNRIEGLSYEEIAKKGGGILNSARLITLKEKLEHGDLKLIVGEQIIGQLARLAALGIKNNWVLILIIAVSVGIGAGGIGYSVGVSHVPTYLNATITTSPTPILVHP